jgi:predicted esterase/catechol 2,3-dioxygenase-like lactoylglutathione lyase family enzyme
MSAEKNISAIHHITAVASSAADNLAFYENVLGLRLVKQTVNFDDPHTYHLYYGDAHGSPGTILTFFPWGEIARGRPGAGMVTAIGLAVPRRSIGFWETRFKANGIPTNTTERFGEPVIQLSDPDGLPLELVGTADRPATVVWQDSLVPETHALRGFHSATATLRSLEENKALLTDVMGMSLYDREDNRYRFKMDAAISPGHFYDMVIDPQAPVGRAGAGTVHHIAFRTRDDDAQSAWQSRLRKAGFGVTAVRDRKYFRSIYFHNPEGILFEIATDPPGFAIDETEKELGRHLMLPDQYERMRAGIEQRLPVLRPGPFKHVFKEPQGPKDDGRTLVLLHGTGGNEHDLVDLAARVSSASAILSPRGRVLENGMPRFFKRLANNVFDERDVVQKSHDLADFIVSATAGYGRKVDQMTALGYSNGANIAAAVLFLRPEVFARAVLLRPMMPLESPKLPDLHGKEILVLRGAYDRVIPAQSTDRLAEMLTGAGADVTVRTIDAGHELTSRDIALIAKWLARQPDHALQTVYPVVS